MWPRLTGVLVVVVMILTIFSFLGSVSAEETEPIETDFPDIEIAEETITGKFGGGDFVGIYNKDKDAMMGVLYGTEEHPNNVYLVALFTRYLGTADVYEDGEMIDNDHPIPVYTLFVQRFAGIYEFNDANDDGMYDSRRVSENGTDIITQETVYKMVPTWTAWERTEVEETEIDEDTKEWSFSLSAKNNKYKHPWGLWNKLNMWNEELEEITLTFHLTVSKKEVEREVPVWRVDVNKKGFTNYDVEDVEELPDRKYSGEYVDASFKYDTLIDSWEYDPDNNAPALLWLTQILYASAVTNEVADWAKTLIEKDGGEVEEGAKFSYETNSGKMTLDDDDVLGDTTVGGETAGTDFAGEQKPELIKKNKLDCADDWQKIGTLTWVNDVEVDGVEDEMYFQVYGAFGFSFIDWNVGAIAGFLALGGFSYPGGAKVYHDPTYSSGVFQISEIPIIEDNTFPWGIVCCAILLLVIGVIVAVVILTLLVKLASGGRAKPQSRMDYRSEGSTEEDFYDSYYMDKKR
jgi:hypothetical protein